MSISAQMKKIIRFMNPQVPIGGLEISDAFLRYALLREGLPVTAQVQLEPGTITDGNVADGAAYLRALEALHAQIAPADRPVHVVASLAASGIYTQSFNLPYLAAAHLAEAARLNLQMISPIDVNRAYYDAEEIGTGPSGETEFLGAFADKALVDAHASALTAAGFAVVAVEFSGLSIARAFRAFGAGYDFAQSYLLMHAFSSGIDFLIIRGGRLHFRYFLPWASGIAASGGREIDEATLTRLIRDELQRVLNFYSGKWSDKLGGVIVLGKGIEMLVQRIVAEVSGLAAAAFSGARYAELFPHWAIALGAGLRGTIHRADDALVSLAPMGTEAAFAQSRREHFIMSWRNAFFAVFGFLFFVYLLSDSLLARIGAAESEKLSQGLAAVQLQEVERLRSAAQAFNSNVNFALAAKARSVPYALFFSAVTDIGGANITFTRIHYDAESGAMQLAGLAPSELAAINFKNSLAKRQDVVDVSLPLASIVQETGGNVSFQLMLRIARNAPKADGAQAPQAGGQ